MTVGYPYSVTAYKDWFNSTRVDKLDLRKGLITVIPHNAKYGHF